VWWAEGNELEEQLATVNASNTTNSADILRALAHDRVRSLDTGQVKYPGGSAYSNIAEQLKPGVEWAKDP